MPQNDLLNQMKQLVADFLTPETKTQKTIIRAKQKQADNPPLDAVMAVLKHLDPANEQTPVLGNIRQMNRQLAEKYMGGRPDYTNPDLPVGVRIGDALNKYGETFMGAHGNFGGVKGINPKITGGLDDLHAVVRNVAEIEQDPQLYAGKSAVGFDSAEGKFSALHDQKPRFEIDDSKTKIKDFGGSTLGDMIEHEDLFKQYPELRNVKVAWTEHRHGAKSGTKASFEPTKNTITLDSNAFEGQPNAVKSTLLHEIQHAIQAKEGFASGGSPLTELNTPIKVNNSKEANVASEIHKALKTADTLGRDFKLWGIKKPSWMSDEAAALIRSLDRDVLEKRIAPFVQESDPFTNYSRLGGELESRDVSARSSLGTTERMTQQPYKSQDIPLKDVIIRYDSGSSASIKKPHSAEAGLYDTDAKIGGMKWFRGVDNKNAITKSGDEFYSASENVAGDYGKVAPIDPKNLPKKPLEISSKDELAELISYKGDPFTDRGFDDLAKQYAQSKGHDGIVYFDGSLGEPELHKFGRVAQQPRPNPKEVIKRAQELKKKS
jgi:hypothetical protein